MKDCDKIRLRHERITQAAIWLRWATRTHISERRPMTLCGRKAPDWAFQKFTAPDPINVCCQCDRVAYTIGHAAMMHEKLYEKRGGLIPLPEFVHYVLRRGIKFEEAYNQALAAIRAGKWPQAVAVGAEWFVPIDGLERWEFEEMKSRYDMPKGH